MTTPTFHEGTLKEIRRITDDGILTDREVWELAEYLNDNPDACFEWPGSDIFPILHNVYADGVIDKHELNALASILSVIEEFCANAPVSSNQDAARPDYESVSLESMQFESFQLPKLGTITKIKCKDSGGAYRVNLAYHSCNCPTWKENHKQFGMGDIKRACTHLVQALGVAAKEGKLLRYPGILAHAFQDLASRGRGIDHNADWTFFNIEKWPYLVAIGEERCTVYARIDKSGFDRYAYNVTEQRWTYGNQPKHHLHLEKFINTSIQESE